ncbi:MAG: hypothetical protein CMI12_01620 [Oceanospirillum sp.]|nr:hypothetical protein [Oceanospirillum sp.]
MDKQQQAASAKATNRKGKTPKKIIALQHLMERSLNQLEALPLYGETCLHSTISTLSNDHDIDFDRVREQHQHQGGGITHFMRYTLTDDSRSQAQALVNHYIGKEAA